jgi:hypothetical protein
MGLEFTFGERSSADAIGKLKSSLQVEFFLALRFLTSTASDDEKSLSDVLTKRLASF